MCVKKWSEARVRLQFRSGTFYKSPCDKDLIITWCGGWCWDARDGGSNWGTLSKKMAACQDASFFPVWVSGEKPLSHTSTITSHLSTAHPFPKMGTTNNGLGLPKLLAQINFSPFKVYFTRAFCNTRKLTSTAGYCLGHIVMMALHF